MSGVLAMEEYITVQELNKNEILISNGNICTVWTHNQAMQLSKSLNSLFAMKYGLSRNKEEGDKAS